MSGIYQIYNPINNKRYIGSSINVERRLIDRLNKLIPMEILMPLGGAGFVGHELNKE